MAENWQSNSKNLKHNNCEGFQKLLIIKSANMICRNEIEMAKQKFMTPNCFRRGIYPLGYAAHRKAGGKI